MYALEKSGFPQKFWVSRISRAHNLSKSEKFFFFVDWNSIKGYTTLESKLV